MDKFEDSMEGWGAWVFNLNTQIGGVSRKVAQLVEKVLVDKEKAATKQRIESLVGKEEVDRYGGEVFRLLSSLTKGEANTVVRSAAIGQDGRHNGFLALKLLSNRFNPKTPAKLFRALMEILVPGMVKEVRDVPRAVEEWEVKCARVAEEYGEKLSEGMRVAVLIMMLPKDMQEMIYQMGKVGEDLTYQEVRDKVVCRGWA